MPDAAVPTDRLGSPPARRRSRASLVGRLALLTSVALVSATGCSVAVDPVRAVGALVPFSACDQTLDYLKREALERVGPYGLDSGVALLTGGVEEGAADARVAAAAPTAPGTHSTTNIQEAGVDEPDLVKTDGEHIVSVVDSTLRVVDAAAGEQVGQLELGPDASAELLLAGDRALVLVRQSSQLLADRDLPPGWHPWQSSRLLAVDLSDPSAPAIAASLDIEGDIISARLVDGVVRVAIRSEPALDFPPSVAPDDDDATATARNRQVIESSELVDWLPSMRWSAGDDEAEQLLVPCERLSSPPDFAGFTTVSVLSLDFDGDLREPAGTAVLGGGDTVYSSLDRFYVVTTGWTAVPMPIERGPAMSLTSSLTGLPARFVGPGSQHTAVHAFDISEPGPARYLGSGEVEGTTIGQYALSEWEGNLRIATTTGAGWGGGGGGGESRVTVLAEADGVLEQIGLVDGLGPDERIYAVRYVGPTAYVVTFRQTDPLYVLDLSDPTEPRVRGELKITGYSAYLHPLGDGRVIGVGQEARRDGRTIGAQVSLFDVSDPAAPLKLDGHVVPGGWSEAEHEARAFLYWEPTGQLVIPMSTEREAGALVLAVDGDTLTEVGWVTSTGSTAARTGEAVRRSLVIDDRLFTVWPDGIQSNDLQALDDSRWLPFS